MIKDAWMVGSYLDEIHDRISLLGYKVTDVFPRFPVGKESYDMPGLIVFTDDCFMNMEDLMKEHLKYPETIFLTMSAHRDGQSGEEDVSKGQQSVQRLLYSIHEREFRFLN